MVSVHQVAPLVKVQSASHLLYLSIGTVHCPPGGTTCSPLCHLLFSCYTCIYSLQLPCISGSGLRLAAQGCQVAHRSTIYVLCITYGLCNKWPIYVISCCTRFHLTESRFYFSSSIVHLLKESIQIQHSQCFEGT